VVVVVARVENWEVVVSFILFCFVWVGWTGGTGCYKERLATTGYYRYSTCNHVRHCQVEDGVLNYFQCGVSMVILNYSAVRYMIYRLLMAAPRVIPYKHMTV
jgi:hypothetical protein